LDILIDGESGLVNLVDGASGEGLLERLEATLYSSGRVASSYVYNGVTLSDESLQLAFNQEAPQGRLEITTMPLSEHFQLILQSFSGALANSAEQLVELSEGLTDLDPTKSLEQLGEWCKDISAMCESLGQLLHMLNIPSEDVVEDGMSMHSALAKLQSQCTQMAIALREDDSSALADLLECEMVQTLEAIRRLFPALGLKVEAALAPN
jgi:hypothetical protein